MCINIYARCNRGIAQLVEHRSPKPSVVSSNLTAPANKKPPEEVVFLLAIGKVMVRTHEKVSLTTSESDTGYRGWQKPMSASATQIFINQVNLTAPANKKPPEEVVFLLAIGKVMIRTHENVSLTTNESDTGDRSWQKPMSVNATQIL